MAAQLLRVLVTSYRAKGIMLIEILLAVAIISAAGLLITSYPNLFFLNSRSARISAAKEIASRELDYLRKKTYVNLINTPDTTFTDPDLTRLPSSSASFEIGDCPINICTNPAEKIKQVKVKINWSEKGKPEIVEIVTMVAKGGIAR